VPVNRVREIIRTSDGAESTEPADIALLREIRDELRKRN
jgi:large-conductance mechanosensitive channel